LLALGKLFPADYGCEVRLCSKLVHTSALTLCSLPFELALIYVLGLVKAQRLGAAAAEGSDSQRMVEEPEGEPEPGPPEESARWRGVFASPAVHRLAAQSLLTLSKSAGLAVASLWVVTDLRVLSLAPPGPGAAILGSAASVASLLALLAELGSWLRWLPKSMERFRHLAATAGQSASCGGGGGGVGGGGGGGRGG
jgi:hypothetical protein